MNKSSNSGDNLEEDIAFVSQAYQAAEKPNTSQDLDASILKMAQEQINTNANTSTKPASFAWWKNQHYQGAIAASVLVVCLVYILPSTTSNIQTENPTIAELPESQQAPSVLSEDVLESEQQEVEAKRRLAYSSSETAKSTNHRAVALARAKEQNQEKVASPLISETSSNKLSVKSIASNEIQADAIATNTTPARSVAKNENLATELIAQNMVIIEDLLKLQAKAKMPHQQIMSEALIRKRSVDSEVDGSEIFANLTDTHEPSTPYLELQTTMKQNLHNILNVDSTIDIAKTYKDVLSPEEIEYFMKIAANAKQP